MTEGLAPKINKEESEPHAAFSVWAPIPPSRSLARRKWELFEQKTTGPGIKEQPHGIDLFAANFLAVSPADGTVGGEPAWFKENPLDGMEQPKAILEPGKKYFVLISPALKRPYRLSDMVFHLLPKSTLHRVGIAALESSFSGTENEEQKNQVGLVSEAYEDGRRAAIEILVLNPNGVEIEKLAPLVQAVLEKAPNKNLDTIAEQSENFLVGREQEKHEPLHLGRVSEFLPIRPRIATDPKKTNLT